MDKPIAIKPTTWFGLTDEEIHDIQGYKETREMYRFVKLIESLLKEKNGSTLATPTPGAASFTHAEYADYLAQRAANHAEDQPDWNNQL